MNGFAALSKNYDGFIVDLWGVVHNGVVPYPGVLDCLANLKAAGKRVVFLSNAPRRAFTVARGLAKMGITPALYTAIMSSGEAVFTGLRDRTEDFEMLGHRFYHLGPERDYDLYDGLALTKVDDPILADFLLNSGPDTEAGEQDASLYQPLLDICLQSHLPMICANPDLEVVRGNDRIICAGLLAQYYAHGGGYVIMRGKPDAAIYRPTLDLLGLPANRVLAIGDSLRTDITGAQNAGIDSAWVLSGIHALHPNDAPAAAAAAGLSPIAIIPGFCW